MSDELERILALMRSERPGLRLVHKADSPLMRAVGVALWPITPDFADAFTTVLGDTVYLPRPPDQVARKPLARTLAHEFVHQLDMDQWGPVFYATYAAAMPALRTSRAHWERRAYAVDLMLSHHDGGRVAMDHTFDRIVPLFSGPAYGWMWAGRDAARRYLEPVRDEVVSGTLQVREPYARILAAWRG